MKEVCRGDDPERPTIDVDQSIAMTDQSFRRGKEVVEADAKTNLLDDFVGVFGIDIVFNSLGGIFAKVFWGDLDKVHDLGLWDIRIWEGLKPLIRLTRMNMVSFESLVARQAQCP